MPHKLAFKKIHKLAIFYLILSSFIWGVAGPVIKYTLQYVPPFTFLFLRFLISSIIILPFMILEEKKHPVPRKDWINLILLSFLGGTVSLSLVFYGFDYTTSLDGSILSAAYPLLLFVSSSIFLKEKITINEKKGAAIALFGTAIITFEPILSQNSNISSNSAELRRFIGNILIVLSMVTAMMHALWSKKIMDHIPGKMNHLFAFFHLRSSTRVYSPLFIVGLFSLVSLVSFAPLSFIEVAQMKGITSTSQISIERGLEEAKNYQLPETTSEIYKPLLGILYMSLLSTLVAYGAYEWAIKEIPVAESAVYSYLSPLFAVPFAYLLLGETLSIWLILGGIVIGYGVIVSEKKSK